ncbi:NADH-quinone oxidoreductase subunit C [Occallatibacter savannae]|uniref:NADH-quinone oxidoreductase subunit C n=1 Tax=Occallatibacter savannae TaxID=1002691 RepID=UPI000D68BB57|nr:NADH-quinone oxidoreductase subunit C [Occallatibacter savannae]
MSTAESIPKPASVDPGPYSEKGGVFWYGDSGLNVRDAARAMNAVGARFITITTYELPASGGFRLEYHWDLMGRLLGFTFPLAANTVESIYDLCEAADWIEREIHEEYRIDFTGREYEPLLLREGGVCGVNLQKEVAQ